MRAVMTGLTLVCLAVPAFAQQPAAPAASSPAAGRTMVSAADVTALIAYLGTLDYPKNPFRNPDGSLTAEAQRGREVFRSPKAACNTCHGGTELTDGKIHEAGLEERDDAYRGYNPPSLRGLYDKDPYLHDGRAKSLRETLSGPHSADSVTGLGELSDKELDDLLAYLKSL